MLKPKISLNPIDQEVAFILDLKYALFSHYVWGLKTVDLNDGSAKSIQEQINTFDVRQYARDCKKFGVQYVVFTAWHAGMNPLYHSPGYRKWRSAIANNPEVTDRDILMQLADALNKEHIDLFLYTHPNDIHDFRKLIKNYLIINTWEIQPSTILYGMIISKKCMLK